jgi:hypothetical protein
MFHLAEVEKGQLVVGRDQQIAGMRIRVECVINENLSPVLM